MTQTTSKIIIEVLGANRAQAIFERLAMNTGKMRSASQALNHSLARTNGFQTTSSVLQAKTTREMYASRNGAKNLERGMKGASAEMDRMSNKARQFKKVMLGAGLSMLFSGMALKRFTDGALRAMTTAYKEGTDNTDRLTNAMGRLNAATTFFKFTFLDAVSQSDLMMGIIEAIIVIVDWFSALAPETRKWMVVLLIILGVIGGIMMIGGQIMLFVLGVLTLGVPVFLAIMGIIAVVLIIIAGIIAIVMIWNSDMSKTKKILWTIVVILVVVILLMLIIGAWPALIVVAILLIIAAVWKWRDAIKNALGAALTWLKDQWFAFLDRLIKRFNDLINLINLIPGVNIPNIPSFGGGEMDEYATGGFVPTTGPAILHAGEFVLTKSQVDNGAGGGTTIGSINVSVSGETSDADKLAEIVSEKIMAEFERYTHRGGR
jgi:hypothetical protein